MAKDTRTYADHWNAYIRGTGRPEPPSRWRWVKDAALASIPGFFLGYSVGTALATGTWPALAVSVGLLSLLVVAGVLGLGQVMDSTRQDTTALARIAVAGCLVFVVTAVVVGLANL